LYTIKQSTATFLPIGFLNLKLHVLEIETQNTMLYFVGDGDLLGRNPLAIQANIFMLLLAEPYTNCRKTWTQGVRDSIFHLDFGNLPPGPWQH
jgi:hypothetical protein